MRTVDFAPLGTRIPQIALGCGRLDGRAELMRSTKVIEEALKLGVRYFDVAPLYGMGTAEEALGHALRGVADAVIATKVGIPRPPYQSARAKFRRICKPLADRMLPVKHLTQRLLSRAPRRMEESLFDFSAEMVEASAEESLRLLRRDRIDVLLAHDPRLHALGEKERDAFERTVRSGMVRAFGVGIDAIIPPDPTASFGNVWQSKWPGATAASSYPRCAALSFFGVIRARNTHSAGTDQVRPAEAVRLAAESTSDSIIVVSASTPARLRELLTP